MSLINFTGRLAIYRVRQSEVETRLSEQGQIARIGIPQLYLWALPDEGDNEAALHRALACALDELWQEMDSLFDGRPTADECELVMRFCSVVQDLEPLTTYFDGYVGQALAQAKKRLAARGDYGGLPDLTLGRATLDWYRDNVLNLYGPQLGLGGSIFGWRGFKIDD